jgi:uncharacterized membrane protein
MKPLSPLLLLGLVQLLVGILLVTLWFWVEQPEALASPEVLGQTLSTILLALVLGGWMTVRRTQALHPFLFWGVSILGPLSWLLGQPQSWVFAYFGLAILGQLLQIWALTGKGNTTS